MTKTEDVKAALLAKRANELVDNELTNAAKREAVKFFGTPFAELDEFDQLVVFAWLSDRSKGIGDYDVMPLTALQAVILGEN